MVRFPTEALKAKGGTLGAVLFENAKANVGRDVYWKVHVEFEPLCYGPPGREEEFVCEATCEWLRLGLRDWRALEGVSVDGGSEVASSFYVAKHEAAIKTSLRITARQDATFQVDMTLVVDFLGFFGEDADPVLPVAASLRLPFEGVTIHRPLLKAAPGREDDARALLTLFVDLAAFSAVVTRTNGFKVTTFVLPP